MPGRPSSASRCDCSEVAEFEKEFAVYLGAGQAIGVGTGTDALMIALRPCGIGPADEVITVAHTAVATVAAIEHCGAQPVLVDVAPGTFTLDPQALAAAVTTRTKAVVPVHRQPAYERLAAAVLRAL